MYWKTGQGIAVREGDWKLVVNRRTNEAELYDLATDFRETKDLSKINPEITKHLLELMDEFKKETGQKNKLKINLT